jgi:small conductance mechanosensitive channel
MNVEQLVAALGAAIGSLGQAAPPGAAGAAAATSQIRDNLAHLREEPVEVAAWTGKLVTEWTLKIIGVLLVIVVAWMLAGWARRALYRVLNRPKFDQTLIRFLSNLARWAILIVGIVASLTIFGIAPASLAAIVGAAGLAIGLALQGSLSNLAAGIMLLLLRPFKVGDMVLIAGHTGKVDDIELFNTKIDTIDNRRIIVPNGQIFNGVIENLTHHARRMAQVDVGVAYDSEIDQTRAALLNAAMQVPQRLPDTQPNVVLRNFGPSSVDWQVQVWVPTTDFGPARQALIRAIKHSLDQAGITIPFPQMEIWNHSRP